MILGQVECTVRLEELDFLDFGWRAVPVEEVDFLISSLDLILLDLLTDNRLRD